MSDSSKSSVNGRIAVSMEDTAPQRQDSLAKNRPADEQDTVAQTQPENTVLVLRWDDSSIDGFVEFIEKHGFDVHCEIGSDRGPGSAEYGAIIHLARSDKDLRSHLGDEIVAIADEEWVLLAGDGERDFHCTFQLTQHASSDLKAFVHWLWAIGSVA